MSPALRSTPRLCDTAGQVTSNREAISPAESSWFQMSRRISRRLVFEIASKTACTLNS
jgi:hypothetical protein